MSGPRIGELFAGYGGLGMGVQAVYGGEVAWVSEFDKGANKILAHRFPDVPNHGDITKIDWSPVEPVDILTGGSPCQDLSHAGRRAGMTEGTRSNLWVAMREAIAQLRPPLVVWENVRGAYSAGADSDLESCAGCVGEVSLRTEPVLRALGRVLGDLSELGYDASWHGLRAADVGAPHGRLRVFVVATDATGDAGRLAHGDGGAAADAGNVGHEWAWRARDGRAGSAHGDRRDVGLLPTPTSRDFKNAGDPTKTAGRMAERGQPLSEIAVNALLPTPAVNDMGDRPWANPETWDAWVEKHKATGVNGNGHGKSLAIEAQRLLPTPRATDGAKGGPNQAGSSGDLMLPSAVQAARWGDYAAAIARWEHAVGRPAPEPTQTSSKGNPQLSARFVEWMMGLPAGWVTDVPGVTRNEALKALGNGVVPQQCAEALRVMASWEMAA